MIDPVNLRQEQITEVRALVGEYTFRLPLIPGTRIRVKVWKSDHHGTKDRFTYTISHRVWTPVQAAAYSPADSPVRDELNAVRRAIQDTVLYLEAAVANGNEPSPSWLTVDESF